MSPYDNNLVANLTMLFSRTHNSNQIDHSKKKQGNKREI